MRLAFAGTPEFARTALRALLDAGHEVALVLTQPDRPAGRGLKLQAAPVKQLALAEGIPLAQPRSLKREGRYPEDAAEADAALRRAAPEALVVVAYGLILPRWVLELPPRGCLNIHGSLLPRWRGAAPIQRAIEAGDAQTGVAIMRMDEGLDTGPVLLEAAMPIAAADTAGTLQERLANLGAELIVRALAESPRLVPRAQPGEGASYAAKIDKAEAAIHWHESAQQIERRIRAFDPFPGCTTTLHGQALKVWRAQLAVQPAGAVPGALLPSGPGRCVVACGGEHALELLEVQLPGGRRQPVQAWMQALAASRERGH